MHTIVKHDCWCGLKEPGDLCQCLKDKQLPLQDLRLSPMIGTFPRSAITLRCPSCSFTVHAPRLITVTCPDCGAVCWPSGPQPT